MALINVSRQAEVYAWVVRLQRSLCADLRNDWLSGYRPRAVRHRLTEIQSREVQVAYSPCGFRSSSSETELMQ